MIRVATRPFALFAAILLATAAAFGVDPPDLEINSLTGLVETVDATWSGSNFNVRYSVMSGVGSLASSTYLTTNAADDLDPRIAISATGDAYVAWWRDSANDKVLFRKKTYTNGVWTSEQTIGLTAESNSRPRITIAGGSPWVAYQIQNTRSRSIGAQIIDDTPEPFRSILATTSFSGDLDVQIQSQSGHLWVTWVDTSSRVGYAEYQFDKRVWLAPAFESFLPDSVTAARSRIEDVILGL
jgi:hypothetical protein